MLTIIPKDDGEFRVVVRQRCTGLYVKEWPSMTQDTLDEFLKRLGAFKRVVYLYDEFDVRVMQYIEHYVAHFGKNPSHREIAFAMTSTHGEVSNAMERLEHKGFIERSFQNKKGFKVLRYLKDR